MLEDLSSDISARPVRSHMGHLSRDSYFSRGIPPICARDRSFSSSELCHNQTDPLPDHVVNLSSLYKLTTCRFRRVVRESAAARGFAPATMCSAIWRFCLPRSASLAPALDGLTLSWRRSWLHLPYREPRSWSGRPVL